MVSAECRRSCEALLRTVCSPSLVLHSAPVHRVAGGSAFSSNYNPDQQRKSKCSNLGVKADNSAYWQPVVYRCAFASASWVFGWQQNWGELTRSAIAASSQTGATR